jgi:hypothetical protein
MPVADFFETIEDEFDRGRAPILLALIATSMRNVHPDWSVQRLVRRVENLNLSEVTFIDSDAEEQPVPPADAPEGATSDEPSNGSSSPSTPPASSTPKAQTSFETPPSFSSRGSRTGSPVQADQTT